MRNCRPRRGMSAAFRWIAIAVLAAFIPSSVLGAAPLVWCANGDDHAASEIKLVKRWHTHIGDDNHHRLHAIASTSFHVDDHSHPCLDYELIAVAVPVKVTDLDAVPTIIKNSNDAPVHIVREDVASLAIRQARAPPYKISDPPHLISIRTTILRL